MNFTQVAYPTKSSLSKNCIFSISELNRKFMLTEMDELDCTLLLSYTSFSYLLLFFINLQALLKSS